MVCFNLSFCTVLLFRLEFQRYMTSRCEVPGISTPDLESWPTADSLRFLFISSYQWKSFGNTFLNINVQWHHLEKGTDGLSKLATQGTFHLWPHPELLGALSLRKATSQWQGVWMKESDRRERGLIESVRKWAGDMDLWTPSQGERHSKTLHWDGESVTKGYGFQF